MGSMRGRDYALAFCGDLALGCGMRIVEIVDGALELRWTWLPFWMATSPSLKAGVENRLKAAVALNFITDSDADLDGLHDMACSAIADAFPGLVGVRKYLDSIRDVNFV